MEMQQFFSGISEYCFPMALSCYLLVRMESRLDRLSEGIEALTRAVGALPKA